MKLYLLEIHSIPYIFSPVEIVSQKMSIKKGLLWCEQCFSFSDSFINCFLKLGLQFNTVST